LAPHTYTSELYALSLHDALPISMHTLVPVGGGPVILCTGLTRSALVASAARAREASLLMLLVSVDSAPVARVVSATIEAPSVASAAARASELPSRVQLVFALAPW